MRYLFLAAASLALSPASAQDWVILRPTSFEADAPAQHQVQEDGSLLVQSDEELRQYRIEYPTDLSGITAIRLELLPHSALPGQGPGHGNNGNFALTEFRVRSVVGRNSRWAMLKTPSSGFSSVGWPIGAAIDGRENTGWSTGGANEPIEAVFKFEEPLKRGKRTLLLDLEFHHGSRLSLGCFRVSVTAREGEVLAEGEHAAWGKAQARINDAIALGVDYLISRQLLDGSWAGHQDRYTTGCTALSVYALLKSGVSANHQAVRRGLAFLTAHPPSKTYDAGCQLMAFAAADDERWKDAGQNVLEELLDWQIGDWGYPGAHGNPSAGHKDLSNTQYGTLGLWAAMQMGLQVPEIAWSRLAERVLVYQTADRGFGYAPGHKATGSMTGAGVAVLSLCSMNLKGELKRRVDVAVRGGLGWLDQHFAPNTNPGKGNQLLYYLYGVERVGAFADVQEFNGQNWYREGARQLLKTQAGNGHWPVDGASQVEVQTCYALLFLNRASSVVTGPGGGRKAVTYGSDDASRDVSIRASGDTPLTLWVSSFGTKLLESYAFEGEEEHGLRIARVEYLTDGGVILADSRSGGSQWLYTIRQPEDGWAQRDFDTKGWRRGSSAFGRKDSPQVTVGTEWKSKEIWLRKELELDTRDLVEPRLELSFGGQSAGRLGPQGKLLKLCDEEEDFAWVLNEGPGSLITTEEGKAASGERFLKVTPLQRHNVKIDGWGFPIRANPGPGQYRYIQFAWHKPGDVMVQFAIDGAWGRAVRYFAGENKINFNPAIQVSKKTPDRWTTVTRDLWADLGGDGLLTGLALTPMPDGEACYDAFYLAQSRSDFKNRRRLEKQEPEWLTARSSGLKLAEEGAFVVWINGKQAFSGDWETNGFELLMQGEELRSFLRRGTNLIAVHAKNSELGRAIDLSILDAKRLGDVRGDPNRPAKSKRFATRVSFPRPGSYDIRCRVHVMDEATGDPFVVESKPLSVNIVSALDPRMLEYGTDPSRNLLAGSVSQVEASSELAGWSRSHAVDNSQFRSWLCADGDSAPMIEVTLRRPVRGDTLLLSHTRVDRNDANRSGLPTRVEIVVNGRGDPIIQQLETERLCKTRVDLGRSQKIRSIRVRILDRSASRNPRLDAVGFAEIELQLLGRR